VPPDSGNPLGLTLGDVRDFVIDSVVQMVRTVCIMRRDGDDDCPVDYDLDPYDADELLHQVNLARVIVAEAGAPERDPAFTPVPEWFWPLLDGAYDDRLMASADRLDDPADPINAEPPAGKPDSVAPGSDLPRTVAHHD
jgi:hypothetical protein